jgi:iron complex transport system permease protein
VIAVTRAKTVGEGATSAFPGRRALPIVCGALFLVGSMLVGMLIGPAHLGLGAIVRDSLSHVPLLGINSHLSQSDSAILWQLRAPRVVLGLLVGGMLAIAGASYQGVFRNPLADPYLLGIAAGAGLGATLAIVYGHGTVEAYDLIPLAAFAGAAGGALCSYLLGRSAIAGSNTASLILAGVTVMSFLTAIHGRLDTAGWYDVGLVAPYIGVSAAVLLLHRRALDVLSVGDEEAASLGINVNRTRLVIVVFATIGTAAAVAISGLIGFVGIIVPHAIRLLLGSSYRLILPLALLGGAGFLVLADVIARSVLSPAELPIGVVTAFFGAPFFAVILRTSRSFR